jgi:hypothetical protein
MVFVPLHGPDTQTIRWASGISHDDRRLRVLMDEAQMQAHGWTMPVCVVILGTAGLSIDMPAMYQTSNSW